MDKIINRYGKWINNTIKLFAICALIFSGHILAATKTKVNVKKLAKQNWIEVSTQNFQITSNAKPDKVHDLAIELENFRSFVSQFMGLQQLDGLPPVKFLILKNDSTFNYLGFKNIGGIFTSRAEGFFSIANGSDFQLTRKKPTWGRHVIFHEMIHYFVSNQVSKRKYPLWYNEGSAEYLATMIHDKKKNTITFGRFGDLKWRFLSLKNASGNGYESVDVESLFKTKRYIPKGIKSKKEKKRKQSQFYAKSFAVVHYLNSNKERYAQLNKYITLINSNKSVDDAFAQSFDISFAELTKEVDTYIKGRKVFGRVFKAGKGGVNFPSVSPVIKQLSNADGVFDAMNIRLRFSSRAWIGDYSFKNLFNDVEKYFPGFNKTPLLIAKYDKSKSVLERIEFAKRYLKTFPSSHEGFTALGALYLRQAHFLRKIGDSSWTEFIGLARSSFRKAVKIEKFAGAAYQGLGDTYYFMPYDDPTLEEAFASYDALTLLKSYAAYEKDRANYALHTGRYDEAVKYYTNYINKTYEGKHTRFIGYVRDALRVREIVKLEIKNQTSNALEYIDGSIYKGEIKNKRPNGKGVLSRPTGDAYTGEWVNGYMHGKGVFTSSNGMVYSGDFENGLAHGKGDLKYNAKEGLQRFVGEFYRFMEHGEGNAWMADGYQLKGKMNKGFFDGMHTVTLSDGSTYELEYIWGKVKIKTDKGMTYIGFGYDHDTRTIKNTFSGLCKAQNDGTYYDCVKKEGEFVAN